MKLLRRAVLVALVLIGCAPVAHAAPDSLLADVVVVGVPGLRWSDIQSSPELTALIEQSSVGSISVRTAGPHSCPIDAWLTISAGTRAWDSGGSCPALPAIQGGRVQGWSSYVDQQAEHHTDADLGKLGALGNRLCGFGPGAALAVADRNGIARTWRPTFDPQVLADCNDAVVDATRADAARIVEQARALGRWVLLVGISGDELLPAIQLPPDNGPRWLTSNSTRRPRLVQLADITATLLSDSAPDTPLDGAEIHPADPPHGTAAAVIQDRLDTNERFAQPRRVLVGTSLILLAAQLVALAWFGWRRSRAARRTLAAAVLVQGGFFTAAFLATATSWWRWPGPGWALLGVTLGISVAVAAISFAVLRCRAAYGIAGAAYLTLLVDGVLGTPLQLGSMFADGPVIGGRFYGFGNSTFATLATATLLTAGFVAQRLLPRGRRTAAAGVLGIGGLAVVVDGAPGWGADFGGVIALTPAVLLLAWLTWRGGISWRGLLGLCLAGFVAVAGFAIADYQRAPGDRSHLGAFVGRVLDGDVTDVFARKLGMSFGFLQGPGGWAMLAGVLILATAALAPQRVPFPAYRNFADTQPLATPTLRALVLCGTIGLLLNDAGITVPAIMAGFALTLITAHLLLNRTEG